MPRPGTCSAVAMTADLPGLWISRIVQSNRNAARSHNAHQQPCRTPARASKNDLDLPGRHILPSPASPHVVQPAGPVHPRTRASTVWMTVEAVCSEPVSARFPDHGKSTGNFTLLVVSYRPQSACIRPQGDIRKFTRYSAMPVLMLVLIYTAKNFTGTTSPLPAQQSMQPRLLWQALPDQPAWPPGRPPTGATAHRH